MSDAWDDAPCGLVELDASMHIVRANWRFATLVGRPTVVGVALSDLLAPAARLLLHTQFVPMLILNDALDEVLLEVMRADGSRLPCLFGARRRTDGGGTVVAALTPVPDRDRYERSLRGARAAAEAANRRERDVSVALQQALLTAPPVSAGRCDVVARHIAGDESHEIGGDWYDAFTQPDGTLTVVIGDVVGHDIAAAAAMGQLRGILRTIAYTQPGPPAQILTMTDRAAAGLSVNVLATAVILRVLDSVHGDSGNSSSTDGPRVERTATLEWSNAGHPSPLLVHADGRVTVLSRPSNLLLGVAPEGRRDDHRVPFGADETLLMYTDGLVERPHEDIDDGVLRLMESVAGAASQTLDTLCRTALEHRSDRTTDDVAVIAVRLRR